MKRGRLFLQFVKLCATPSVITRVQLCSWKKFARDSLALEVKYGFHGFRFMSSTRQDTYTSSHFQVDNADIIAFLERQNAEYRDDGANFVIKECHFCPKPHNFKPDNLYKLYIKKGQGCYICHRCGSAGSWFDLKNSYNGPQQVFDLAIRKGRDGSRGSIVDQQLPDQEKCRKYIDALYDSSNVVGAQVLDYLTRVRGIKKGVLERYGVGAGVFDFYHGKEKKELNCITFPWVAKGLEFVDGSCSDDWQIVRMKIRSIHEKRYQRLYPKGGSIGMFGWHMVSPKDTEVIITEGEFDAMSVYQATGLAAISLPNGAGSLPPILVQALERFNRIILWMDNDVAGQQGAERIVKKLGKSRCVVVNSAEVAERAKDANEALLSGVNLQDCLLTARPFPHEQILTMEQLQPSLLKEIDDPTSGDGIQIKVFPGLNKILKGHRKGEITVLTGPTGSGKTTFLSQMSLDLCISGVSTLWGSFEIPTSRLFSSMLDQYIGRGASSYDFPEENFPSKEERRNALVDFTSLPLYCLGFFGNTDVNELVDAMEHAVYVHDVEHIILDNLQFMCQQASIKGGLTKFDVLDNALEKFRRFATKEQVHITIVIHPRKEPDNLPLSISSIFGTAKATQEADNVLILQQFQDGHKVIQVRKNRYNGDLGEVPIRFVKGSRSFVDVSNYADSLRRSLKDVSLYSTGV